MVMNIEAFKKLSEVKTKEIGIKGQEEKVKIKKLKPKEQTDLEYMFINGIQSADQLFQFKIKAIIASVVDDDNNQLFKESDRKIIMDVDSQILTQIWNEIQTFNFANNEAEIEDQAKN